MDPLSAPTVRKTIDEVCASSTELWREHGVVPRQITPNHAAAREIGTADAQRSTVPFFFVVRLVEENNAADGVGVATDTKVSEPSGYVTFYLAYSTWDGRILFLDDAELPSADNPTSFEIAVLQTLARIAVRLQCSRLVWRHRDLPSWYTDATTECKPEVLHGWLTLVMDKQAMLTYAGLSATVTTTATTSTSSSSNSAENVSLSNADSPTLAEAIQLSLDQMQAASATRNDNRLRVVLAQKEDVGEIMRLVQGLADYEKEPDAVNMTTDNYRIDGFPDPSVAVSESDATLRPMFYCLLLRLTDDQPKAVGMAFFYFGYETNGGRFLYLEDLFIEEAHRKLGGGSLLMKTLALCGCNAACDKLVWQALDWNTPALNFYNKIGAKVQDGVLTSRFAQDRLVSFASLQGGTAA